MFSASLGENLSDWFEKLEQYMPLQGISVTDDVYKEAYLEAKLSGVAQASFKELKRRNNPPTTYDQFKQELIVIYPDSRDSDVHQQIIYDEPMSNEISNAFVNCNLDPFCTCKYCPQHGTKNDSDKPPTNTAEPIIQQVDQPPPQKYPTETIMDTDRPKTPQIDEHQLAIDKLTYALNTIEMECEHKNDPIIREKLEKHASSVKLQLAQVIT
uniref:Uncharacterized protein n=1 Tax=Romanomermis culicivorax TaxID=13658 RepID=A0A915JS14_ROMCU